MRPFGERWTAPYACNPAESRGRLYPEAASPTRSEFQRDRDRIIHSSAFRRLKHKTQVFVYHEGDHYRTRLTHTLEVSQIARALARSLGLDEDLAEALALSHDLGHTPFGHTGEDALDACMAAHGGFDHNAQALRVVTRLERRYAAYDGLNLTWETLEGLVKHNGPLLDAGGQPSGRYRERGVPGAILEYDAVQDLRLATHAGGEAQAAAIADDIAYNAHDLDDGLRAGLFATEDLMAVPFLRELLDDVDSRWPGLELSRRIHELVRRVITRFVEDATAEGERRIAALGPRRADDIRAAGEPVIAFSRSLPGCRCRHQGVPASAHVPASPPAGGARGGRARRPGPVRALHRRADGHAGRVAGGPGGGGDEARRARRVADYIAGMTDRYALHEHRRLFSATPTLLF